MFISFQPDSRDEADPRKRAKETAPEGAVLPFHNRNVQCAVRPPAASSPASGLTGTLVSSSQRIGSRQARLLAAARGGIKPMLTPERHAKGATESADAIRGGRVNIALGRIA